jgi:short-subunit dehydrogenase involved in D-alanine esterification of teichoic acids
VKELKIAHPGIEIAVCDVSSESDRQRLFEDTKAKLGGLDILVNNAGVQVAQTYGNGSIAHTELRSEIDINLIAPMLMVDLFLPLLKEGSDPAIVNLASILALVPKASAPGYCASKAGLLNFTRSLRLQLADTPVKMIEVFPPLVETPMTTGRGFSKMSSDQFAREVADALEARRPTIAVGEARQVLRFARWWPSAANYLLNRMIRPSGSSSTYR